MATKQFGRLKLHWSERGFAFKWGDGEIHRLSFGRKEGAAGRRSEDGYDPNDPNAGEYGGYGRGYDQGGYPGQESGGYEPGAGYEPGVGYEPGADYEPGAGYADEGAPAGRYDVLYRSDWPTWLLLVLLPPLGIWILWKRDRLEPKPRLIVSGVAAAWFIVLLIWLFSAIFGRGADPTMGVGNIKAPESIVVGATATPGPTGILTGDLPSGTLDITTTPAPAAQFTPRPGGSSGPVNSGADNFDEIADASGADEDPDTTYIWASTSDSYYHRTDTCTNITGTPSKVSMDIARSRGQTACPVCYGEQNAGATYYMNKGGKYYHKDKTCSGMKNAQAVTKAQATKAGKKACPVCIGAYYATKNGKYYHTKSNCSGMKSAQLITKAAAVSAKKLPCPVCVKKTSAKSSSGAATKAKTYYSTSAGKYYHVNPTCSGMKNARKVTLATAKKLGQKPCPTCIGSTASSGTVYYATTAGKYYHTKANCSGMKDARKITLATAKAKGKTACPVCVKATGSTVYATTAGKYYHSKADCSGMKDARKVALATAKKAGKTACPICMKPTAAAANYYSTVGGKYYHSKAACSGMKNATKVTLATAKKRGQKPCPVCMTKAAQSATDAKTSVYATSGGRYYHAKANCSGMKNARKVTLASAKSSGKTACPVCMKSKAAAGATYVYARLNGKYYHKNGCNTSDAESAKKVALATAKKYGKTPCPVCFKRETVHVYVTPAGLKYHSKVNCSGVHNTQKITLKTALARKYVRCTVCDAPKG